MIKKIFLITDHLYCVFGKRDVNVRADKKSKTKSKSVSKVAAKSPSNVRRSKRVSVKPAPRSHVRGASGRTKAPLVRLGQLWFLFKWSALCVVLAGGYMSVNWQAALDRVSMSVSRPIANISIKGDFQWVGKGAIQELIADKLNGNFVDINLLELKQHLELNPWVKAASVQRVWPDGMVVEIREQRPIARWGSSAYINESGTIIEITGNSQLAHLPIFHGDETLSRQITKTYVEMTEMLSGHGMSIVGIDVDATMAWTLSLASGIEIKMGQYDSIAKLRNFLLVYEQQLVQVQQQVKTVDMRYEGGLAVAWVNDVVAAAQTQ